MQLRAIAAAATASTVRMTDRAGEGVGHSHPQEKLSLLTLGALGVVLGDIGTSPLYALKESFVGHHPLAVDSAHIYGVLRSEERRAGKTSVSTDRSRWSP